MLKSFTKKTELIISATFFLLCVSALILANFFIESKDLTIDFLTRDPAAYLNVQPYIGIISSFGIGLWGISFMAFFMAWVNGRINKITGKGQMLTLYFGLLTLLLYIDDLYMLHDWILPVFFNINGFVIMIFYNVCVVFLVLKNMKYLLTNGLLYIIFSFCGLGISAGVDYFHDTVEFYMAYLIEDGAKLIGIVFWMLFSLSFSINELKKVTAARPD